MKVILTEDDKILGKKGEVAEVKPGYARNYLMRRGLAVPVTIGALKDIQGRKASKEKASEAEEAKARDLAGKIQALTLKFSRASGKGGKLFGSLTAQAIIASLKEKSLAVGKRQIEFAEPIRTAGTYTVKIKLHPKVTAELRVTVEAKS